MRAWRVNELGHPSVSLQLEDIGDPSPGADQVLVRVEATNVNFADILVCQGVYQDRPGVPLTPGTETCGIVEAVGAGVTLPLGTRVAGMAALPSGGYAERALVRAPSALVMPADIPAADATVLYSTFQTAHVGLHHRAGLRRGEQLLVLGAASGVGAAAVQLGAVAGARVIATAGSPAKAEHCRALGADVVLDSRRDTVYDEVMEATGGRGVDVAFDPVGGALGTVTRRLMAWEGRLVVVGFASGEIPSYPANHVLVKNYAVFGLFWGEYAVRERAVVAAAHEELLRLYRDGAIHADVTRTVGLEDVPAALAALEERAVVGRLAMVP